MDKLERVDELLAEYCTAGYALGLIGEANIAYVVENFGELVTVQSIYRLGDQARLKTGVSEGEQLDELLAILEGLSDYLLIDDEYLSQLIIDGEIEWIDDFAKTHKLDVAMVHKAVDELGAYFEWEQDYVYYAGDVEELLVTADKLAQGWNAHYYSGEFHSPEVCGYCKEAKEVA